MIKWVIFLFCAFIGLGALISTIMIKDYKYPSEIYEEIKWEFYDD